MGKTILKRRRNGKKKRRRMALTFLRKARKERGLTQAQAAEQVFLSQAALSNLERGAIFSTKGELKPGVTKSIHDLAALYRRPELEEFFCTQVCPIGKNRKQLAFTDFCAIWKRLNVSLEELERNANQMGRTIEDGHISEREWRDWPQMVQILSEISYLAKSANLWARVIRGQVNEAQVLDILSNNVYYEGRASLIDQRSAAEMTGISVNKLSAIERKRDRDLPTPDEALIMSRAFLSPRIRNFFCYHDCEIGGSVEPLDIQSGTSVCLKLAASLLGIKELRDRFSTALKVHGEQNPDPNGIQEYLDLLNVLSRRVDTVILWSQEVVCRRMAELLADNEISPHEQEEYVRLLAHLEQLGTSQGRLEELRSYLHTE